MADETPRSGPGIHHSDEPFGTIGRVPDGWYEDASSDSLNDGAWGIADERYSPEYPSQDRDGSGWPPKV
jgi:hypothetical protein